MSRIHLVVSEPDRARYAAAARREGLSLSAWLRAAAGSADPRCCSSTARGPRCGPWSATT